MSMAASVHGSAGSAGVCGACGAPAAPPHRRQMMLQTIPSGALRGMLDRALDAQAANDEQQRLIDDQCPERVDSILEHLDALERQLARAGLRSRHVDAIRELAQQLARSNREEREMERAIAGAADDLARVARRVETGGTVQPVMRRRELAARLRAALTVEQQVLAGEPVAAGEVVAARREIAELIATLPASRLLSRGLAHELGHNKTALLHARVHKLARQRGNR